MIEPWFNPNQWAWLPATLFGCSVGLWGSLGGALAPRGKARGFVLGFGLLLLAASMGCLAAGLIALRAGQPYGVWYGLILPGMIGLFVPGPLLLVVRKRYREAEERRMSAEDLVP